MCHGIPTDKKVLKNGDIINIDVTVIKDGYHGDTSKMLGESALCLIHDTKDLPEKYGVITPTIAMGDKLIPRLEKAGIRFRIV